MVRDNGILIKGSTVQGINVRLVIADLNRYRFFKRSSQKRKNRENQEWIFFH